VAALYYSLMETAKLCGVDPKRYLREAALAALRGEAIPLPNQLAQPAEG
jgi:transposase